MMWDDVTSATFGEAIRAHLAEVEELNADALGQITERILETIRNDGLLYVAGTGHSLGMVLETYFRAGGLACVYPIHHPGLLPLGGGTVATTVERVPGLGRQLVEQAQPGAGEVAIVASNSGVNPVPVEIATAFRDAGVFVASISSRQHMSQVEPRADHKLIDVVDMVLDTGVPYGDAVYPLPGRETTTAGLSSLVGVYLWDLLLARLADKAGREQVELPVFLSANAKGGDEHNAGLIERYRGRIPGY